MKKSRPCVGGTRRCRSLTASWSSRAAATTASRGAWRCQRHQTRPSSVVPAVSHCWRSRSPTASAKKCWTPASSSQPLPPSTPVHLPYPPRRHRTARGLTIASRRTIVALTIYCSRCTRTCPTLTTYSSSWGRASSSPSWTCEVGFSNCRWTRPAGTLLVGVGSLPLHQGTIRHQDLPCCLPGHHGHRAGVGRTHCVHQSVHR